MLDIANDIRSLSDFKRNTSELLDRLKKTGNPLVLTINGKAEIVVQDAERAQRQYLAAIRTLATIRRLQLPEAIQVNIGAKQVNVTGGTGGTRKRGSRKIGHLNRDAGG